MTHLLQVGRHICDKTQGADGRRVYAGTLNVLHCSSCAEGQYKVIGDDRKH